MHVIRAKTMGMCPAVSAALATIQTLPASAGVTVLGELVHNPRVTQEIERRGICQQPEDLRETMPATPVVLVTAHGISNSRHTQLIAAGKEIIDATCPLVRHHHDTALKLQNEGWFVVIVGDARHVEVQGVTEDLSDFAVVPVPADARRYDRPRIAVVAQTTVSTDTLRSVHQAVVAANEGADVKLVNTLCDASRQRVRATQRLLRRVEALVVVGGHNSNNTQQLVQIALAKGCPVQHVDSPDQLDVSALRGFRTVGLTAGTSTLGATVDSVEAALQSIRPAGPQSIRRPLSSRLDVNKSQQPYR